MLRTPAAARFATVLMSAAFLVTLATGCASSHTSWKKGQAAKLEPVKETGYYDLVTGKDNTVVARYQVYAGEQLGFRTGFDGRVEAVAGMYTVPLSTRNAYAWKLSRKGE